MRLFLFGPINRTVYAVRAPDRWHAACLCWDTLDESERERFPKVMLERMGEELDPNGTPSVIFMGFAIG